MLAAILISGWAGAARAGDPAPQPSLSDSTAPLPPVFEDVGIDEKPNAQLPLDLTFVDDQGKTVHLGDYFQSGRPVILQLGYFNCPKLCGLIAQGLVKSLSDMTLHAGTDYEVVSVSIDPNETWHLAHMKKASYMRQLERPAEADGWHLLVGNQKEITQLAQTVGFKYHWIPTQQQFAHAAVLMILTPEGRVSRYLYGVKFPPRTLRLSLVESSEGKIGSTVDRILLFCCQFDSSTGKYTWVAMNIMRAAAALTVVVLGAMITYLFLRNARQRREEAAAEGDGPDPSTVF